jgi:hypothetical protein
MDPKLRRIADYLLARLERDDIDPLDIAPDLLPHFFILEIRKQGNSTTSMYIRLVGTALDAAFGRCVSGRDLEDFLHGPRSADVLNGFRRCHAERQPLWMRQVVRIGDKVPRFVEGVACPIMPNFIYGGLHLGEANVKDDELGFECRPI